MSQPAYDGSLVSTTINAVSSGSLTVSTTVSGDALLIFVQGSHPQTLVSGISGSAFSSFSQLSRISGSTFEELWWVPVPNTVTNATVQVQNSSATGRWDIFAVPVKTLNNFNSPFDANASIPTAGIGANLSVSETVSTNSANDLIIAGISMPASGSVTPTGGFSIPTGGGPIDNGANLLRGFVQSQGFAGAQSNLAVTATLGISGWVAIVTALVGTQAVASVFHESGPKRAYRRGGRR